MPCFPENIYKFYSLSNSSMVQSEQDKKFHSIMKKLNSKIEEFEETNKALGIKKKKGNKKSEEDTVPIGRGFPLKKQKGPHPCCRCAKIINRGLHCPSCRAIRAAEAKKMKEKGQTWQY